MKNPILQRVFLLFLIWSGIAFSPCKFQAASPLQKARQQLESGRLEEAKNLIREFSRKNPKSPDVLYLMGNLHLAEDQIELAQTNAAELLRLRPEWAQTQSLNGAIGMRLGDFESAEAAFKKCLRENPRLPEGLVGLGRLYLSRLQEKEALASFRRAMALNPGLAEAYFYSAEAYGLSRGHRAQIQALEKYLSLRPSYPPERVQNARSTLQFLKSCSNLEFDRVDSHEPQHEIAIESFYGLMIVRVFVDGKGPYKFLVDTGASSTVLSNSLFDSLNLKTLASAVIKCVGGTGRMVTRMGLAGRLTLGTLDLANVPVGTFDEGQLANLIDGVLSPADLAEFIITFRPSSQKMILSCRNCPSHPRPPEETGTGRSLELRMMGSLLLLPGTLQTQLSGQFLFDTGALMSALSDKTAKALGANPEQAVDRLDLQFAGACGVTQSVIPLKDVTLKVRDLHKKYPQIMALDLNQVSKELQTEILGILGMDFWGDRILTLDYLAGSLWIE